MGTSNSGEHESSSTTRRNFLKSASAAAVAATVGPTILHATDKAGTKAPVLGKGDHQYEVVSHQWGELPSNIIWGETHGVAIDEAGMVYIKHRSSAKTPMDAIAVFDPKGKFVRSFGKEYHTGGHGIDIRKENGTEYLYLSDVSHNIVVKATLDGNHVWQKGRPQEPGVYDDPKVKYSPTNVAFGPDGGFYIADGYGSNFIHQYDADAKWVRTWGGTGKEPGKMQTPHGIWLDNRPGRDVTLVVADRANGRLQYFSLDGKHLGFVLEQTPLDPESPKGVSFPAHFDLRGDVMLVPDLHARVSLFDKDNKVITHLGYDPAWTKLVLEKDGKAFKMRGEPSSWQNGKFIHPHDACFDKDGNIFVVEWVPTGRVTFLRKV